MADEDDRAFIIVQRVDQRLAAIHVEVVCRLVEDQKMRRMERGEREEQARLFTARELFRRRIRLVRAETDSRHLRPLLCLGLIRHQLGDMVVGREFGTQLVHLMLGEVAIFELFRGATGTGKRREFPAQQLRQRRFAVAIRAKQTHAVIAIETQIEPAQDRLFGVITHTRAFDPDQRIAKRPIERGKAERDDLLVDLRGDRLHFRERLQPALSLLRLCRLRAESLDERFHSFARVVLRLLQLQLQPLLLAPRLLEAVIAARVEGKPPLVQMQDAVDGVIKRSRSWLTIRTV